jgi:AraC-like DNA-binding protein
MYTSQDTKRGCLVRSAEIESHLEVNFDCTAGSSRRLDQAGLQHLRLEVQQASLGKIAPGTVLIPANYNAIAINMRGTLLVRAATNPKLIVVPPRSMTFMKGRLKLGVVAARGEHSTQIISWASAVTPLLEHWINTRLQARSAQHLVRPIACKPIDPHFLAAVERLDHARTAGDSVELVMLSAIYEIVSKLMMGADEVQLATIPYDLPDTLKNLTQKVRGNPAMGWPLKEAADMAGYSPFHFSRVFKQLVGYGFHEYVDRCRTECAIEMLVSTDSAVDLVASTCGFGTTQGLRESVKEYLGLVPSELRSMPEAFAFLGDG